MTAIAWSSVAFVSLEPLLSFSLGLQFVGVVSRVSNEEAVEILGCRTLGLLLDLGKLSSWDYVDGLPWWLLW